MIIALYYEEKNHELYNFVIYKYIINQVSKLVIIFLVKKVRIMGRIRSCMFLCIFTVAFLLFLAPAGGCNPAGQFSNPTGQPLTFN